MKNGGARPGAGRPKGAISKATAIKMKAKEKIAQFVEEHIDELLAVLYTKAIEEGGDMPAIKELFDRAWGRAPQSITGAEGKDLPQPIVNVFAHNSTSEDTGSKQED